MNSFGVYLRNQKLARQFLVEAQIQAKKGNAGTALVYAMKASECLLLAVNNVAALAFRKTSPRRARLRKVGDQREAETVKRGGPGYYPPGSEQ